MSKKDCDIVMKGGITSGVVYPPAIKAISEEYRFKCIGGTSAGAIAATATAAAQLGELKGASDGFAHQDWLGFKGLEKMQEQLKEDNFLFKLFQPQPKLRRVWKLGHSLLSSFLGLSVGASIAFKVVLVLLLGFIVSVSPFIFLGNESSALEVAVMLYVALWVLVVWVLYPLYSFLVGAKEHSYGFCTGTSPDKGGEALMEWLHVAYNRMAGKPDDYVLTFGELERAGIELKMVTTGASHERPFALPFQERYFLFDLDSIRKIVPKDVAQHLDEKGYESNRVDLSQLKGTYKFLPKADLLPVVLATRMSLSFPILFTAVKLYTIDYSGRPEGVQRWAVTEKDLQECWFTDGGVCSNFPINMFDDWLPSRPTFGISLGAENEEGRKAGYSSGEGGKAGLKPEIRLPLAKEAPGNRWKEIKSGLTSFLSSAWASAQNHENNLQAELPGCRERIVEIPLSLKEGGLNLNMDPSVITTMAGKGKKAGEALVSQFEWEIHQWVRLRVLMAELADKALSVKRSLAEGGYRPEEGEDHETPYDKLPEGRFYTASTTKTWYVDAIEALAGLEAAFEKKFLTKPPTSNADIGVRPNFISGRPDRE